AEGRVEKDGVGAGGGARDGPAGAKSDGAIAIHRAAAGAEVLIGAGCEVLPGWAELDIAADIELRGRRGRADAHEAIGLDDEVLVPAAANALKLERRPGSRTLLPENPGALARQPEQICLIPQVPNDRCPALDLQLGGRRRRADAH